MAASVINVDVGNIASGFFGLIDNLFTSDQERAEAKLKLLQMERNGELEATKTALSAILAEAQSQDRWTSRARPAFMYVIYLYILAAIPMGIVYAFRPELAGDITEGVKGWLTAIPENFIWLFGAGYLGYTGARSFDKWRTVK
jgi:hypothetical protein